MKIFPPKELLDDGWVLLDRYDSTPLDGSEMVASDMTAPYRLGEEWIGQSVAARVGYGIVSHYGRRWGIYRQVDPYKKTDETTDDWGMPLDH